MKPGMNLYEDVRDSRAHKNVVNQSKRPRQARFAHHGPLAVKKWQSLRCRVLALQVGCMFVSDAADGCICQHLADVG